MRFVRVRCKRLPGSMHAFNDNRTNALAAFTQPHTRTQVCVVCLCVCVPLCSPVLVFSGFSLVRLCCCCCCCCHQEGGRAILQQVPCLCGLAEELEHRSGLESKKDTKEKGGGQLVGEGVELSKANAGWCGLV